MLIPSCASCCEVGTASDMSDAGHVQHPVFVHAICLLIPTCASCCEGGTASGMLDAAHVQHLVLGLAA